MLPYEREVVFVLDYAEGGSLGQLLLARPALDPGEVVTVATPWPVRWKRCTGVASCTGT